MSIPDWLAAISNGPGGLEPFRIVREGERWGCATDGHMMAAIRVDAVDLSPPLNEGKRDRARYLLSLPAPYPVTRTLLRKTRPPLLGPAECNAGCDTGFFRCQKCEGSGKTREDLACSRCYGEGELDCECSKPHLVSINDSVVFNAHLLWRALPHVTGRIRMGFEGWRDPIILASADWRIVVMPMEEPVSAAAVRLRVGQTRGGAA